MRPHYLTLFLYFLLKSVVFLFLSQFPFPSSFCQPMTKKGLLFISINHSAGVNVNKLKYKVNRSAHRFYDNKRIILSRFHSIWGFRKSPDFHMQTSSAPGRGLRAATATAATTSHVAQSRFNPSMTTRNNFPGWMLPSRSSISTWRASPWSCFALERSSIQLQPTQ